MFSKCRIVLVAALSLSATAALAESEMDIEMKHLALNSGCFICHHVESGSPGPNGMAPIGPAWQDVAAKYRGQNVQDTLVKTVMQGSNPYGSHWKGKVSGLAMPPNAVAIKEEDARKLVSWILSLAKK
jgi:cytochrome c